MAFADDDLQISIDGDFECGSAGLIRTVGAGIYEIDPKPEPVPDWFSTALDTHFDGAGVPREYAFNVRVLSRSSSSRTLLLRFPFTATSGRSYMDPPYWVLRRRWRPAAAADTRFEPDCFGEVRLTLAPGETVCVANKPYLSLREVEEDLAQLQGSGGFQVREIGRTAQDRPLLVLETVDQGAETILISATAQPAEPAARPVLAIAHWLLDGSALTARLRRRFRFCFLPMPNPDGCAAGLSVTNAAGEVPMFSYGRLLAGEPAPAETAAIWGYAEDLRPTAYVELHTHYQGTRAHKLNPMALEWFPGEMHGRATAVEEALLRINADWRVTAIERSTPLSECGLFASLSDRLGTLSYCYQVYAESEEATCAHAVTVASTLARALAGGDWEARQPSPRITPG